VDDFINLVEKGLLDDLVDLYTSDLRTHEHSYDHVDCIACAKKEIVVAILHYRRLDASRRAAPSQSPRPS
jgi:hypothetical protein